MQASVKVSTSPASKVLQEHGQRLFDLMQRPELIG
jgi:hypothetical protein